MSSLDNLTKYRVDIAKSQDSHRRRVGAKRGRLSSLGPTGDQEEQQVGPLGDKSAGSQFRDDPEKQI